MEKGQGKKIENQTKIVNVDTSKTCVQDKGKEIEEDTNCNLTTIKDNLLYERPELLGCDTISLNGPNIILNGVECENGRGENIKCCTLEKKISLKDLKDLVSSHCQTCVNASESLKESTLVSSENNKSNPSLNDIGGGNEFIVDNGVNDEETEDDTREEPSSSQQQQDQDQTAQPEVEYVSYQSELQMPDIMRLIQRDLSEPYSIYTYRYFIHNWPQLCFLAMDKDTCVGAIVCKLDVHRKVYKRGYIAMLAVDEKYRKRKIGSNLVLKAIRAMVADGADEVVLETEITNKPALRLYENLGFVRDKRLFRYYLNGVDALRLKLWLR
ncbi:N-alpha-acetyltransferase 30 [Cimex lectularius]|uniref:N-terminal methionine N(alpha)-acetyltransferase NatC n=1 Tax=Cimex lectularius TaxID=79782 RepID=A0A8I6S4S0_CIMLE|nr:N-alpha-acetyltransferase 30 [Cimex lectularius]